MPRADVLRESEWWAVGVEPHSLCEHLKVIRMFSECDGKPSEVINYSRFLSGWAELLEITIPTGSLKTKKQKKV